jgi:hypothetical protein
MIKGNAAKCSLCFYPEFAEIKFLLVFNAKTKQVGCHYLGKEKSDQWSVADYK